MMSFIRYYLVICVTACLCLDTDALAQDGSEVLDKLKRYDSIYESGFTVSATRKCLERLITGQAINVERRWRLAFEGDRCGYLRELIEYEKPKFQAPKGGRGRLLDGWMYTTLRRRQWGYWGSDASGMHLEDMSLKISPENEIVQVGTIYNSELFGPKDAGPNVAKRTVLWSLGRFFSQNIDEVTFVKPSADGRLAVSALGSKGAGWTGRWELEIEPAAAWMVREARFYHDIRPDAINCEMKNSGTAWSGPYCIPQYAQFNYGSSIKGSRARADGDLTELTFDFVIEQFDEKLYEGARRAVIEERPPKLTITDWRMSPPLIFQPGPLIFQPGELLDIVPKRPPLLVGRSLPELKELGIDLSPTDTDGKIMLICFWDMEQRPSRNCLWQLSKRAPELKAKDVVVVAVQASKVNEETLNEWIKKNNIQFPVGMVQGDEDKPRFTWGVRSLPWLILTDKKHIVQAEGFGINELDEKISIVLKAHPSIEETVKALASDTSIPLYAREGAPVDGLEVILADSRVRKLVKYATISKQNWKEVVEHIVPIIHDYARYHNPKVVTSTSDSYTKGWRTGYDSLIVVLAAIGYAGALPDVLMSYESHQAEINNPIGKINPDHGRWIPVDCGHNRYFFLYMDKALHLYASDEKYKDQPPSTRNIAREFVTSCEKASRQSYRIEGYDFVIRDSYTVEADPYDFALRFWQATEDTGYLRGYLKRKKK